MCAPSRNRNVPRRRRPRPVESGATQALARATNWLQNRHTFFDNLEGEEREPSITSNRFKPKLLRIERSYSRVSCRDESMQLRTEYRDHVAKLQDLKKPRSLV